MSTRRSLRLAGILLTALSVATCRDSAGNEKIPTPGWLSLSLTTPSADDGGILFTISGAVVDSVRSVHPYVITRREGESLMRVVIGGNLGTGMIGEVRVPDTRAAGAYAVVVQEVAVRATNQQRAPAGYAISVSAPVVR